MKKFLSFLFFIVVNILVLLDVFTEIEINNSVLLACLTVIVITTGFLLLKQILIKWINKIVINLCIVLSGVLLISKICVWSQDWKTQTIIYQNLKQSNRTIEFQMLDNGANGFRKRTVDRIRLLPFLDWIKKARTNENYDLTWKKVDIDTNELNLKGG